MIERKTKTVQDVLITVKRQFGDESGVQLTDSDIIRWVDDAQREVIMNNPEINATVVSINVTAGTYQYPILASIPNIEIVRSVHYDGQILRNMSFQSAQEYIIRNTSSQNNGTPTFWYEYAGTLNLWPVPQTSLTGGLQDFFLARPPENKSTGDVLTVPDSYFNAIITYVMKQAMNMDENFQAAQAYDQQFEISMQKLANRTQSEQNTYPTITLLPGDSDY